MFGQPEGAALGRLFAVAALRAAAPSQDTHGVGDRLADETVEWTCASRTQQTYVVEGRFRRSDLELRFAPREDPAASALVLFEVKHGIAPHDHQLADYELVADRERSPSVVVLIAPRDDLFTFDPDEIPPSVVQVAWQDVARSLAGDRIETAVGVFLRDQLIDYLEEEGLTDPAVFSDRHVAALMDIAEARQALQRMCAVAARQAVASTAWTSVEPGGYGQPRRQWWWGFTVEGDRTDRWWDLKLLLDEGDVLRGAPPVPCVTVGATFAAGALSSLGRVDALAAGGFEAVTTDRSMNPSLEYALAISLIDDHDAPWRGPDGLDAQGAALGEWCVQKVEAIRRILDGG